jgi:Copper transport outer membrane protein, MctB
VIDFRYHLVSIVAVFLALGLGLVLGSTTLKPSVLTGLEKTSSAEKRQIDHLYATQGQLTRQLSSNESFAQAASGQLLGHLLEGQRVVIVTAPGAPSGIASGVTQMLGKSGATVTGEVQMQPKFFDTTAASQTELSLLTQRLTPAGMTLLPGSAQAQAAQVLGSALLTRDGPGQPAPGQQDSASVSVLNGFAAGNFLSVSGHPAARATLAVVIPPASPPPVNASDAASQFLVTLAQKLHQAGQGTVVAGSIAGSVPNSAIDVMRSGREGHMSSVDDADTVIGQIVVVQALFEQMHGGRGSYGVTSSADAAGPSPAPSASPTPTAVLGSASETPRPTASAARSGPR